MKGIISCALFYMLLGGLYMALFSDPGATPFIGAIMAYMAFAFLLNIYERGKP